MLLKSIDLHCPSATRQRVICTPRRRVFNHDQEKQRVHTMVERISKRMINYLASTVLLLGIGLAVPSRAEPGNDNRAPDLSHYQILQVPAGNKVTFDVYAEGFQIYRWDGMKWVFSRPEAVLYAGANAAGVVGTHYAGPTWESNSGSYVLGAVLERFTPNPNAIPWLLLKAVDSDGPGIFDGVTYIQRVHTEGGLAPTAAGNFVGQEVSVPYAADYYFYRQHK
jgi:hypothetical protein